MRNPTAGVERDELLLSWATLRSASVLTPRAQSDRSTKSGWPPVRVKTRPVQVIATGYQSLPRSLFRHLHDDVSNPIVYISRQKV